LSRRFQPARRWAADCRFYRDLEQTTAAGGAHADRIAALTISGRGPLKAGDTLKVTVPPIGDIHQPRDTD
jgi:hypothetical protein